MRLGGGGGGSGLGDATLLSGGWLAAAAAAAGGKYSAAEAIDLWSISMGSACSVACVLFPRFLWQEPDCMSNVSQRRMSTPG